LHLVSQEIASEKLIYNPHTQLAHCLELAAWQVLEACENPTDAEQIAAASGLPLARVEEIATTLVGFGLLQPQAVEPRQTVDRRQFLSTLGKGAALAGISTVLIPDSAAATSCAAGNGTCSSSAAPCGTPAFHPSALSEFWKAGSGVVLLLTFKLLRCVTRSEPQVSLVMAMDLRTWTATLPKR